MDRESKLSNIIKDTPISNIDVALAKPLLQKKLRSLARQM